VSALLLLVDLQNDYLAADGLVPPRDDVVRGAAALLDAFRAADAPVAHVWTTVSREDDRRMPHWKRENRWMCEAGTPGHAPPDELRPAPGEAVVHKTGFGAFTDDALPELIEELDPDLVVVAGVHAHACVRQAVLDLYDRHAVEIWVAEDAVGSNDPEHAAATRRWLEPRAARYVAAAQVLARLR
jgi:alpha-ketoglutaric semialdehyde dehydrogenase